MTQGTAPFLAKGELFRNGGPFAHVYKVGLNASEGRNKVLLPLGFLGIDSSVFFFSLPLLRGSVHSTSLTHLITTNKLIVLFSKKKL